MDEKQKEEPDYNEAYEQLRIPDEVLKNLEDPTFVKKAVQENKTFQDIIGYSADTMQLFYDAAYNWFQEGNYEQAADAFVFLTTLNPFVHNYWLGLGMSEHRSSNFEGALTSYGMAILIDEKSAVSHYHLATCHYEIGENEQSLKALELAIKYSDVEEYASIKERALKAKKRIENMK